MKLQFFQKLDALAGVFAARGALKNVLIRNFWAKKKTFPLDVAGVKAVFSTADFYSNWWFYRQSQVENYVYEPFVSRLIVERSLRARAFVDVGANLGYFTVLVAKVLQSARKQVYSFEMDASLIPLIHRNLELNGLDNVQVVNAYIVEKSGPRFEYTPHAYSFLGRAAGISTEGLDIKLSANGLGLDDYFQAGPVLPNLMKMDIDGAEMGA